MELLQEQVKNLRGQQLLFCALKNENGVAKFFACNIPHRGI